jgi:Holliday junction DNA helicase RuvA
VKGIGVKTALRALTVPVGQIAQAIESKDARALAHLKGIGKRTAELMIAELAGKVGHFASGSGTKAIVGGGSSRPSFEEDAIQGLMALGEPRPIAERLLERVKQTHPEVRTTNSLLREMLRFRTVRV